MSNFLTAYQRWHWIGQNFKGTRANTHTQRPAHSLPALLRVILFSLPPFCCVLQLCAPTAATTPPSSDISCSCSLCVLITATDPSFLLFEVALLLKPLLKPHVLLCLVLGCFLFQFPANFFVPSFYLQSRDWICAPSCLSWIYSRSCLILLLFGRAFLPLFVPLSMLYVGFFVVVCVDFFDGLIAGRNWASRCE